MNHAIPFFTTVEKKQRSDDRINVGTAFLATYLGADYLISAAHVPSGIQPTTDWADWDRWMTLRTPEGEEDVDLFSDNEDGTISPRFGFRVIEDEAPRLNDVMWIPLAGVERELRVRLARHFTRFSLIAIDNGGTSITAHGFPDYVDSWPQLKTVTGRIARLNGLRYMTTLATSEGFSGGPVVDESGNLVGMTIGRSSGGESTVVPTEVIRALVAEV
jgi:hypothetical protein